MRCPKCGQINTYYVCETIRRYLFYDKDGKPVDSTDGEAIYSGTVKRCPNCSSKIIEDE